MGKGIGLTDSAVSRLRRLLAERNTPEAGLRIAVKGGGFRRVLERNTRLPAEKSLALPVQANQQLKFAVMQGTSSRAEPSDSVVVQRRSAASASGRCGLSTRKRTNSGSVSSRREGYRKGLTGSRSSARWPSAPRRGAAPPPRHQAARGSRAPNRRG
jgi:Fe-S cluster assembly iron-binding protein IscA